MNKFLIRLAALLCLFPAAHFAQERFRRQPPVPDRLAAPQAPEIDSVTLSNRLRMFFVPKSDLPLINLHVTILTGESASPDDLPGLATFAANMLSRGTENFSQSQIEERLDLLGGRFRSTTYPDTTEFTLTFLEEHLDAALELLSDMLISPAFPRRQIEDLQRITFYDLASSRNDPEYAGKKLLYRLLFDNHAYRKILYNDNIIRNYSQGALRSFYANHYLPGNALLVITGNLTLETATSKVSRYFNKWKDEGFLSRVRLTAPVLDKTPKFCFLEIPRRRDATIFMGALIPPITSEDYFPLLLLNQVLGGSHISRLFMQLRESKNYAYRANSFMEFFQACGAFYVQAHVKPEFIEASVQEILNEIARISKERIPDQEIETAKSYLLGQFPLQMERRPDLAAKIAQFKAWNLGDEHFDRYHEKIMRMDSRTVFEAAQRNPLFTPIVVIMGDASILKDIDFPTLEVYNHYGEVIQTITKGAQD